MTNTFFCTVVNIMESIQETMPKNGKRKIQGIKLSVDTACWCSWLLKVMYIQPN
jgi:hypothetical protein